MTAPVRVLVSRETDDEVGAQMIGALPGVEVVRYDPNNDLPDEDRDAAVLIPPYRSSHRPIPLLAQLPALRHVQLLTAGADEWAGDVPAHVSLATARGAQAGPVSEWALSAILTMFRQWPALVDFKREHTWAHRRVSADTLDGARVMILGAGAIGTATADRLRAFGAVPVLVASTERDGIHGPESVPGLLPYCSVVVITAPLTEQTHGMVDAAFLAALPEGALVVNAGRGKIVDTDALVAELQTGRLRAALDVTEPEPLPEHHPLWDCPGTIISPHMARTVPGTNALCYSVAAEQIASLVAGERPAHLVIRH
ncbi:NAD(P)-dependent oxidoreductase [Nocardioides sp.]|uniref:NAD(P)-dependent oxidoreductase n=1 Tax=Nocardioides sp. TaxID=35761 RepID=UPI002C335B94|nr:NAD(P)-dependent oxidoreductase [Nocardioides sp.]HSX69053.1 NAD(P)-dependent oxidoreductase [Nocardioides sp.]